MRLRTRKFCNYFFYESLFQIRLKAANEEVQRAGEIREMRRDIARMKTVLRERALEKTRSAEQES